MESDATMNERQCHPIGSLLLATAMVVLAGAEARAETAGDRGPLRGVYTDQRVDLPLDPARADAPNPRNPPAPVRIAPRNGGLDGVEGRVAPIEIVAAGGAADLVWDTTSGDLLERDQVVARKVAKADLPAAADRVALVRRVREMVQRAPRALRLVPEERVLRNGARLDVTVAGVAGRAVVMLVVAGDGTTTLVHPLRSDRPKAEGDVIVSLDAGPPFGTDQIVVVTAGRPLDEFVTSLRRLDRRRAAGEVLGLLDALEGEGVDVGTQSVVTQP